MNLAAGLGRGADMRARELSLAAGARSSVEHSQFPGADTRTTLASRQGEPRRFEDELEGSLSTARDGAADEATPVVLDQGHRQQRELRTRNKADEPRAVSTGDDSTTARTDHEHAAADHNGATAVAGQAREPEATPADREQQPAAAALPGAIAAQNALAAALNVPAMSEAAVVPTAAEAEPTSAAPTTASPDESFPTVPAAAHAKMPKSIFAGDGQAEGSVRQQAPTQPIVSALPGPLQVEEASVLADGEPQGQPATIEAGTPAGAAITAAAETPFHAMSDEGGREATEEEAAMPAQDAAIERRVTGETFKAATSIGGENHQGQAPTDPRVSSQLAAIGMGSAAPPRLNEFEAARAGLAAAGYAEVPDADTNDRIVQSMRLQFQRGGGDAIVQIRPEHLGPLTISLRVEHGSVLAHVTADNPVTAEWLHANEQTLRDGLKSSGLQLDRLVINRDPDPSGRSPQREERQPQREQRRRFNDRQSTFEITV